MANKEDEIKKRMKESIDKIDLYALNENVSDTVNKALEQAAQGMEYAANCVSKGVDKLNEKVKLESEKTQDKDFHATQNPYSYTTQNPYYQKQFRRPKEQPLCVPPSGKILGRVAMGVGGTFTFIMAMMFLITLFVGVPGFGFAIFVPLSLLGSWFVSWGSNKVKRYERYLSYVREMHGKPYAKINRLAKSTGKTVKYTLKDIREMIRDGVFPTGRVSDEDDYLMLTNEVYQEYLALKREVILKQKKETKKERKERREQFERNVDGTIDVTTDTEEPNEKVLDEKTKKAQEAIEIGREYSRQIEEANDIIETEDFSEKLFRLQLLIDKIFACIEQNPEKLPEIKQLMDYYLPTTLKLVNAYRDFYLQPVQGENITAAKAEIEKAIDTINIGFENLLDDLYKQDALDITSDIYVLENMLAREGLTENEFEKMKSGGL